MRAALALCVALVGCGPETREAPTPPDVEPVLARFETIDGTLDPASARALIEGAVGDALTLTVIGALLVELDAAAGGLNTATDSKALRASADGPVDAPVGRRRQGLTLEAGGWAELTHICPGANRAIVDRANGAISLRTVLDGISATGVTIDAVELWGEATDCLLQTDDGLATLQASILGAMSLAEGNDLLVELVGVLSTPGLEAPSAFDIAVRQAGGLVELVRAVEGNGTFLIGVDGEAGVEAALAFLTDAGGTWACTFDAEGETGACERDGERFTWP